VGAPAGKISQEEVQVSLWPDSSTSRARSSFDSLLSRVRRTMDDCLKPFDSKRYLVVKRGYLCLENCRIDAHEFKRLVRKAGQQVTAQEFWPAEITFSSAFSLWQGAYVPGNFGCDLTMNFQDELERIYLDASQTFARLLAESGRFQPAVKVMRDALRYDPANDEVVRLLYRLSLAQEHPRQASQILKSYKVISSLLNLTQAAKRVLTRTRQNPPADFLAIDFGPAYPDTLFPITNYRIFPHT
jgi:LuxR family maltose regulon positive regulatory protein